MHECNLEGKHLYVKNYELKWKRLLQKEELKDKADWNNYKQGISLVG